jgi:hypothetical protein
MLERDQRKAIREEEKIYYGMIDMQLKRFGRDSTIAWITDIRRKTQKAEIGSEEYKAGMGILRTWARHFPIDDEFVGKILRNATAPFYAKELRSMRDTREDWGLVFAECLDNHPQKVTCEQRQTLCRDRPYDGPQIRQLRENVTKSLTGKPIGLNR